jgi:hypothetical protein
MNNVIKTILDEWKERKIPEMVDRDINLEKYISFPRKIIIVSGFRRTGKTYITFQLIKKLLKKYNREQVIYINFEDERIPLKTEFLTQLIPTIKENFSNEIKFLFLDEIQSINNWSKWVRRIYDSNEFFIFITGSSSKLSINEIPTELRGRFVSKKIFPLSFEEFMRFKDFSFDKKSMSPNKKAEVVRLLNEYLKFGGLPEIILEEEDKKLEILQNYYSTVVNRDIIERFKVKNEEGLKAVLRLLMNSTSFSVNKLYNTLKSMGLKIGKTTILNYVSYIETSYFMYQLFFFSRTMKDQLQYPKKIYYIDNGFLTALSLKFSNNIGRLYENQVCIELKRRQIENINHEIYYWKNAQHEEVDFIIKEGLKIKQLIQVCYNISDYDTKKREIKSLLKASEELKCNNLLVINENKEMEEKIENKLIKYIPLWKWLLK